MTLLRLTLALNGLFSMTTGLLAVVFASQASQQVIKLPPTLIGVIGVGLAFFGVSALFVASKSKPGFRSVAVISAMDFAWVLLVTPFVLTPVVESSAIVGGCSLVVLCFALAQVCFNDLRLRTPTGHRLICFEFVSNVPMLEVWARLSDLGNISHYIPDLASSKLVAGSGLEVGAIRECVDVANQRWQEECVEVGTSSFVLKFATESPDYPYPLQDMHGGWELNEKGTDTLIKVWWTAKGKGRLPQPILFTLMAAKAEQNTPAIIHGLTGEGEGRGAAPRTIRSWSIC